MYSTTTFGVKLTAREQQILRCIAAGMTSKQIAGELHISTHTVANHRKNMLKKKGAATSAQLVQLSMQG